MQQKHHSTSNLISVRFCVHKDAAPCNKACPSCCYCSCCQEETIDACQIVLPATATVGDFLQLVNDMNQPKKEYGYAFINGFRLKNEDPIGPTIKSYIKFSAPIVVVPKEDCCLLI